MPNEEPIAYTAEFLPVYDNTPTVVSVIMFDAGGLVYAIRRANQPGYGLLGLPGGYHMRGETWQQAGAREVFEETGLDISSSLLSLASMETDEYGNNLVIAVYRRVVLGEPVAVDGEALEILRVDPNAMTMMDADWAFPRHRAAVMELCRNRNAGL